MEFKITEQELKIIDIWDKCKDKYAGAIGGHLTYTFTPTSLGCTFKVKCGICKLELDLSNYDVW